MNVVSVKARMSKHWRTCLLQDLRCFRLLLCSMCVDAHALGGLSYPPCQYMLCHVNPVRTLKMLRKNTGKRSSWWRVADCRGQCTPASECCFPSFSMSIHQTQTVSPSLLGSILGSSDLSGLDPLRFLRVALRIEISTRCEFCVVGRIFFGFFCPYQT